MAKLAGWLNHPLGDLFGPPGTPPGAAGKAAPAGAVLAGAARAGTLRPGASAALPATVTAHAGMGAPLNLGAGVAKALSSLGRGARNAWAGAETAGLDIKSGMTEAFGSVTRRDVGKSLAADEAARTRIARGADAGSFAFKAGRIATHVVVDTAAAAALAAGGEFVLGAAGVGAAAAGTTAAAATGEAAIGVAGRLAVKAAASGVASGAVTAVQGGNTRDVLKSAAVGFLSIGVGHAVGEAVSPLAKAAGSAAARAAPAAAPLAGKAVQVGAEGLAGAATGGIVSAMTGGKPHDIARDALFGGALSGVGAVFHTPGPTPDERRVADAEQANRQAHIVAERAKAAEPALTRNVEGLVKQGGGTMPGLSHRLKSQDSLARKVAKDMDKLGLTAEQAAAGVADAIRYTASFRPDRLTDGTERMLAQLRQQGNSVVKLKNTWLDPDASYKGVSAHLSGADGQLFEIQFHTPQSYWAKGVGTHHIYKAMRGLEKDTPEWEALNQQQMDIARTLKVPDGIARIQPYAKDGP